MKRITLAMLLLITLLLTGCAKSAPEAGEGPFTILREHTEIALDAPAAPILEALGIPCGYAEHSCKGGVEKTYRFPGMELCTYPAYDGERILGVQITGGSMQTEEGVSVGTSARQVQECYGLETLPTESCTVKRSGQTMTLTIRNSVVTSISYAMM